MPWLKSRFILAVPIFLLSVALSSAATVTVSQHVVNPDATAAIGTVYIKISQACRSGSDYVGNASKVVPFTNGSFSVSLVPNDGGCSATTYAVTWKLQSGQSWSETWLIPASPSTTSVSAVIQPSPVTTLPVLILPLAQLDPAGATTGQGIVWNGSRWAPGTVSGSGGAWGSITGTLSNQTDLAAALGGKQPSLGTGTTSQYLRGDLAWTNFPSIPTITGSSVLKGSSGSAVAAAYTDVVGLFGSGSCSGYLKSDGTCGSSSSTGADPLGSYWVSRSTNAPANGVNLGSLSTGLLKITVASGVATPSTAVANTDYLPVNPTSLTVGDGTVTGQFQLYPAGDATHYFGLSVSSSRGTALMLTAPSADPTAGSGSGQALACGAPSSNVSTCSWYTPATVTGSSVLKGSSGSAVAAAYADVVGLFGSGSCSGYLKSDGTCSTVTGGGVSNKYAAAISGTSTSISAATHGLGSTVVVSGCKDGSGAALWPDWSVDGSGNVTVTSAVSQSGTCYIFGQSIYAASISGTSTSITAATHGLGTGVIVSGCKDGANNSLAPDWSVDGSGNVTITSAVSQSGTCYLR
jgi:hypothetical protein